VLESSSNARKRMDGRVDQVIKVYTTPSQLRELADEAEKKWPTLMCGDDATFKRVYLSTSIPIVELHFLFDQSKMNEQTKT